MGEVVVRRLALVVGSQCEALDQLEFLPVGPGPVEVSSLTDDQQLVPRLRDLLVDGPGGCAPVRCDGESQPGLLLNPTQEVADNALKAAMQQAHEQEAVLLVCFVGHGTSFKPDPALEGRHFLHVWDTVEEPRDAEPESRAWDIYDTISRRRAHTAGMVGLVLLVDACYAAWAKKKVDAWSGVRGGLHAAWLGSSGDEEAWDGCFTRTLVSVLQEGLGAADHPRRVLVPELLTVDLQPALGARCTLQSPFLGGYENHDPVLFVGRNASVSALRSQLGIDAATEALLLRLTDHYVPFAVGPVVDALDDHRVVAVLGGAGSGKSALAAALRYPPPGADDVPLAAAHAIAFLNTGSSASEVAVTLGGQLDRLPAFGRCRQRAEARHPDDWDRLDHWARLAAALGQYRDPVRLLLDGLDVPEYADDHGLLQRLSDLIEDPRLTHVKVVVTARSAPRLDVDVTVEMPAVDFRTASLYLGRRNYASAESQRAAETAHGNWLLLELLANTVTPSTFNADHTVDDVYDTLLAQARADGPTVDAVLAVLAAAGTGPVLPFELLYQAVGHLVDRPARVELHRLLGGSAMRHLLDRSRPGQPREHVGLFHQTLTDHLLAEFSGGRSPSTEQAHAAIADAIDDLAPTKDHTEGGYRSDPMLAYAFAANIRHLYLSGRLDELEAEMDTRRDPVPSVNLARALAWQGPIEDAAGSGQRAALSNRGSIATFTGNAGDAREAVRLFGELLPEIERAMGPQDRDTLRARAGLAFWIGQAGDFQRALALSVEVLRDREREFGPDDDDTLHSRSMVAAFTGHTGDAARAVVLFEALVQDWARRGPDTNASLAVRHDLGLWMGKSGDVNGALRLLTQLLPVREAKLGPTHTGTLATRAVIAGLIGEDGDPDEALRLSREVLAIQLRVLGPHHRLTMSTQGSIAKWLAATDAPGATEEALTRYRKLLADREHELGDEHPHTLTTRYEIARLIGHKVRRQEGLAMLRELLPDRIAVLGASHVDTLAVQAAITELEGGAPW